MTSGVAVRLRDDFGAAELRSLAARSKDGPQARRLLALAAVAEGRPRTESYARKLVTVISGGVFDLLDPVLERHSFDELGEVA